MLVVGFSGRDLGSMVTVLTKKHIIARMAVFGYLWVEIYSPEHRVPIGYMLSLLKMSENRHPDLAMSTSRR